MCNNSSHAGVFYYAVEVPAAGGNPVRKIFFCRLDIKHLTDTTVFCIISVSIQLIH